LFLVQSGHLLKAQDFLFFSKTPLSGRQILQPQPGEGDPFQLDDPVPYGLKIDHDGPLVRIKLAGEGDGMITQSLSRPLPAVSSFLGLTSTIVDVFLRNRGRGIC